LLDLLLADVNGKFRPYRQRWFFLEEAGEP
jgi:hypothetical protein